MSDEQNCVQCGEPVPYYGRGRPRIRHDSCMTKKQIRQREYTREYFSVRYKTPEFRDKIRAFNRKYYEEKGRENIRSKRTRKELSHDEEMELIHTYMRELQEEE
tara:strand:- start:441 stop:752 length:312 start_codon:yes stop_codon:yes gene_type:complete